MSGYIAGLGLKILLLASYDKETKNILNRLKLDINHKFERYDAITLLVENLEIFVNLHASKPDYSVLIENQEQFNGTITILEGKSKIIETVDFSNEDEYKAIFGKSGSIDLTHYRKLREFEKLDLLSNWSDLIYAIRDREETRGGELVELTYLLLSQQQMSRLDPSKLEFFCKQDISVSTMLKELLGIGKVSTFTYGNYETLRDLIFEQTEFHISRLNTIVGRFKAFEQDWS